MSALNPVKRKWDNVDIIKLHKNFVEQDWINFLSKCIKTENVQGLVKIRYGIQASVADYTKAGLTTEPLTKYYIYLNKCLEKAAQRLFKQKYHSALDDPMCNITDPHLLQKEKEKQRKYRREFELFLRDSAF